MAKLYRTPQIKEDYKEIFKESAKRFGERVARQTLLQIQQAESRVLANPHYGTLDPKFHSTKFRYVQAKNRQKLFYTTIGEDVIVMITAGYDGRNWIKLLTEMDGYISQQIEQARQNR